MRWFSHVMRRGDIKVVKATIEINVEENGGRGKPKKRLIDRIQYDS